MTQHPKLAITPIKEIIFTISYSETVDIEKLKKFTQDERITTKFNSVRDGFKAKLSANEGKEPQASISNNGYVLKCINENKIIQAREGSFSFHKVNEYEVFEVLLKELLVYWNLLSDCIDVKLSINNLSLRYLNFIEINEGENVSDLVKIKPTNPFLENPQNYFMQLQFVAENYSNINVNLITTTSQNKEDKKGVILDIILNQKFEKIINYDLIQTPFHNMREVKNEVFFKSITDYTIKKYSHEK